MPANHVFNGGTHEQRRSRYDLYRRLYPVQFREVG
jgi:hypothetical protein